MTLFIKANIGARGNAATKIVTNPYWITARRIAIMMNYSWAQKYCTNGSFRSTSNFWKLKKTLGVCCYNLDDCLFLFIEPKYVHMGFKCMSLLLLHWPDTTWVCRTFNYFGRTHFQIFGEQSHLWIGLQIFVLFPASIQVFFCRLLLCFLGRSLTNPVQDLSESWMRKYKLLLTSQNRCITLIDYIHIF